jgi:hypothetical protein
MMRVAMVVAGLILIAGCGRAQPGDMAGPNSSTGMPDPNGNVTPPPVGSNGMCNDLTSAGGAVSDTLASAAPALNGGAMVDGLYVLTKYEWYSPNTLHSRSITLMISGGGRYGQYLWQRDSEPVERVTVNIATSADRIAMKGVCPVGEDLEWDRYDTSGGGLTLYSSRDAKAAFFVHQ